MKPDEVDFLSEAVEQARQGVYRWDTVAWYFVQTITQEQDGGYFALAPDEVRAEIRSTLQELHERGHLRRIVVGTGEAVDYAEQYRIFEALLQAANQASA